MFSKFVGSFKKDKHGAPSALQHHHDDHGRAGIVDDEDITSSSIGEKVRSSPDRHVYSRPHFLQLADKPESVWCDHQTRPVITPKDVSRIPLGAGYAECINGGKSPKNEDEAAVASLFLPHQPNGYCDVSKKTEMIKAHYFAIFDGHAGPGASLMAADQLINHLQEKLVQIQEDLYMLRLQECGDEPNTGAESLVISIESLVRGALEAAFVAFDEHIARERLSFNITGGCAAIVALVLLDRVFVAHAGDCRAVAYMGNEMVELATEFTPETDAQRIQYLANVSPELTHKMFSDNYFLRPLNKRDIGNKVYYRAPQRSGWHYKEVTEEDVYKPPLVAGQGKWARLMGVIGVTRGFGDHGLVIPNTDIHVKPFLTAVPEVRVMNLKDKTIGENDVLVMGCDGLWDLLNNEHVRDVVKGSLADSSEEGRTDRYTKAAEDIVLEARGENIGRGWRMKNGQEASFDDITAFVIPLHRCVKSSQKKKPPTS